MKKVLIIVALVLILSASVIAGTLAMYTTTIDDMATGSVVAKEFVLTEGGTNTFSTDVKIAPSESVEWQFSVRNYDGSVISETAMDLDFDIEVAATTDKSMIEPLVVTVTDGGSIDESLTDSGTLEFSDEFTLSDVGQEKTYTVTVTWPSDGTEDASFAGDDFGTTVTVSVTGTQK
jgi:hypothetical protein